MLNFIIHEPSDDTGFINRFNQQNLQGLYCNKRRYRDENQKHVNLHGRFNHFSFFFIQLIIVSLFAILISLIHFQTHLLHNHDCSESSDITLKKKLNRISFAYNYRD